LIFEVKILKEIIKLRRHHQCELDRDNLCTILCRYAMENGLDGPRSDSGLTLRACRIDLIFTSFCFPSSRPSPTEAVHEL
jgi:hypothetical protein